MEPSCVRHDAIPGTSRLFSNYIYNFDEVSRFYPAGPPTPAQVLSLAQNFSFPDQERAAIVAALTKQNSDSEALQKLAKPGTVAVVTGQQVGLFSGPAYTVFKALTAVKLAEYLETNGIPAVPVFWLATEDHDLAEVDHTWVFNEKGTPSRISASALAATGGPVGTTVLNDLPLNELRAALGALPFADEVMAKVNGAYVEGGTLGNAFEALVKDLLGGFGLLYLNPLHPEIRKLSAPLLVKAAEKAPELVSALRERSAELEAAGYHSQVLVEKDSSLLFLLKGTKRLSLRLKESRFISRDVDMSAADLAAIADQISPNALLRPVLQDFLLPTVAYVAGPSELAYFAQSSVLYERLLGRMPVIYPRNSLTLLDERAVKLMTRNHLRLPDLLDYKERVKSKIADRLVPKNLTGEFKQLEQSFTAALGKLQQDLHDFDPTLQSSAQKSSLKIPYQLQKLQRKTARETLRRDEKASADADYLLNLVFPNKHLQERLYSIVPFLAKFGLDLPQRLYAQIQLSCPDHMLRTF